MYSPMEGDNWGESVFIAGEPPPPPGTPNHGASWVRVSPRYFDTIGTRIVEGRANNEEDTPQTRTIAVVNRDIREEILQRRPRDRKALQRRYQTSRALSRLSA